MKECLFSNEVFPVGVHEDHLIITTLIIRTTKRVAVLLPIHSVKRLHNLIQINNATINKKRRERKR